VPLCADAGCLLARTREIIQIGRIRRMTQWAEFRDISETQHRDGAWKRKEPAGGVDSGPGMVRGAREGGGWPIATWHGNQGGVEEDEEAEEGEDDMIDLLGEDEGAPLLTTFGRRRGT
jgi:hypothetical protein